MTIRYVFREDAPVQLIAGAKADPQRIGEALAEISEKNGGRLTPGAVVEAARGKRHPLNKHFEWDDAAAAEAFRLDQARSIIRLIRVADDDGAGARAFLSIADRDGTAYRTIGDVLASGDLQMRLLHQAERDLQAFERRYRELSDVCDIVVQAREKIAARLQKHETRAVAAA